MNGDPEPIAGDSEAGDAQDAVTRNLADLSDEEAWTQRFAATSAAQWDRLAEWARREVAAGEAIPLEDCLERVKKPPEGAQA